MKNISIIGAGLGGLTAGALLAKKGHKVTILEQHSIVGGCATTFNRKGGFTCEVGLHEMESVYTNPHIKEIFDSLGVYENIEFIKAPEFFSVITKNGKFIMPDGLENAQRTLIEKFPKEEKGIKKYFKLIAKIHKSLSTLQSASWYHYLVFPIFFWDILVYKSQNVMKVLDNIIEDKELKFILNTNIQYYNDNPNTLSFLMHSVAQYSYYSGGGWFIKGGSGRLSDYLAKVINDNGGKIITKAHVIACYKNNLKYIYKKKTISIETDTIISNLSPEQTYRLYNKEYKEKREIANSLLTIYLGFSQNIKSVYGKGEYSNFIFDDIASVGELNIIIKKDISQRGFVFVDYSQINSGLCKSRNKSFGAICTIDYFDEWQNLDEEEYQSKKSDLLVSSLRKLEKYYPNISSLVEYAEVGTAKTVQHYIQTPKGTAYGFKPTPKQFFKVPKSKSKEIDNLYFVGQWVIAGGFSPAIVSGGLCFKELNLLADA